MNCVRSSADEQNKPVVRDVRLCVSWSRTEFLPWVSEGVKRAQIGFVCGENLKGREKQNLKLGYIFVLKKVNIPPP